MKKLWIGVGIGVVALAIVLIVTQIQRAPEEIKIGWIGPLSGDVAFYGRAIKNATDLAIEEINSAGGVKGRKIRVLYEDVQMNPKAGTAALTKLITVHKVPVVIQAAGSSVMLAEAPIAEKNKVVLISPTCSNDKIKYAGDYIFRNWPSDSYQGKVIADFAVNILGKKAVAVLFIDNDYGTGLKDIFLKRFRELGGKVVLVEKFAEGTTDFRTQLTKIKTSNADFIYLASHYREGSLVVKQAKELGIMIPFVAVDGCFAPEFIALSGGAAEGVIIANMRWHPESEEKVVRDFVTKYRAKYGQDPEVYAAAGYDCIKIIAMAIEKGGTRSEAIKNALYKIKDFQGVTGLTSFDEYGEVTKEYDMFIVKNGKFVLYRGK
jgi:branched-chain amino acid transport system substrate-binding protein